MNWVLVSPDVSRKSRNNKRVENATLFRFGPEFDSRQLHLRPPSLSASTK